MNRSSDLDDKRVVATVRKLREGLGDTLQAFSERLGLAIASVVRYERNRTPRGKALVRLESVARANGFDEYAGIFRKAMNAEFAVPTQVSLSQSPIQFRNEDEAELCGALLDVVRQDWRYAKEAKAARKLLSPVIAVRRREAEEDEARGMQQTAIVRLLESGRSVEDVMKVFRTNAEAVAEAFFNRAGAKLMEKRMCEVVAALFKSHWSIEQIAKEFGGGSADDFIRCAEDLDAVDALTEYYDRHGDQDHVSSSN
jgi:transcriptional regulator with XRE-family HTH domain